jgi:hypothetical protein
MDFRNHLKINKNSGMFQHFYFGDMVLSLQVEEGRSDSFNAACWKCESHEDGKSFGPFVPLRNMLPESLASKAIFVYHDVPYGLTVSEAQAVFEAFVDYGYRYLSQFKD